MGLDVSRIIGKIHVHKSFRNLILIGLCALPLLFFKVFGKPNKRGFFCGDESLSYPYHSSTVPSWALYLVGFAIPFATIAIGEFVSNTCLKKTADIFNCYLIGAVGSQLIVDVCKYFVGRLRPHFFDVCQPQFAINQCDFNSTRGAGYVQNYTCAGNHRLFEVKYSQ